MTSRFVEVVKTATALIAVAEALSPRLGPLLGRIWPEYFWDEVARRDLGGMRREAAAAQANQARLEEKYNSLPADVRTQAQALFHEALVILESRTGSPRSP